MSKLKKLLFDASEQIAERRFENLKIFPVDEC
jgi:hypothetical protein